MDDLFEQVEFFVDSVSDYKSDFILFPEYFNAPLMARFNDLGEAQSIRKMAQYTEEIRDRFRVIKCPLCVRRVAFVRRNMVLCAFEMWFLCVQNVVFIRSKVDF